MTSVRRFAPFALAAFAAAALAACEPEVGSKEWCQKLDEKPKGDWSANEATEYTKSCVLK